jgi:hypothetical protein
MYCQASLHLLPCFGIPRQIGKCHLGTKKFLDAFGENDQPWDRWLPLVFDDDDFLAYQRLQGRKAPLTRQAVACNSLPHPLELKVGMLKEGSSRVKQHLFLTDVATKVDSQAVEM